MYTFGLTSAADRPASVSATLLSSRAMTQRTGRRQAKPRRHRADKSANRSRTSLPKLSAKTRYLKLAVRKDPTTARILLGEIEVIRPAPDETEERPGLGALATADAYQAKLSIRLCSMRALPSSTTATPPMYSLIAGGTLAGSSWPTAPVVRRSSPKRSSTPPNVLSWLDWPAQEFRRYPSGRQTFRRVVIGGEVQTAPNMTARVIDPPFVGIVRDSEHTGLYPIIEYTLSLPLSGDNAATWASLDQQARTLTYHPDQQFTSDVLFQVPPDPMVGQVSYDKTWSGPNALPVASLRPSGGRPIVRARRFRRRI